MGVNLNQVITGGWHIVQMVNFHEFSIYYVSLLEGTAGYPQTFEKTPGEFMFIQGWSNQFDVHYLVITSCFDLNPYLPASFCMILSTFLAKIPNFDSG